MYNLQVKVKIAAIDLQSFQISDIREMIQIFP